MKQYIRRWLGIDVDVQGYRQELQNHRRESSATLQHYAIDFINMMNASTEAELRDKFAMSALQGAMMQNYRDEHEQPDMLASHCYRYADAMLIARKK